MGIKITETGIQGLVIIEPQVFGDHRGFFMESWNKRTMEEAGLFYNFVQDNHSSSTVKVHCVASTFNMGIKHKPN